MDRRDGDRRRRRLMGLGGGFLPTDISGLKIWLKSDVGITKDGGNLVSTWADQSGEGNDEVQASGTRQPLLVDNQLDGKPTVRFDGVDNRMKAVGFVWTQPESIYIVFKQITWNNGDGIFDGDANSGGKLQQAGSTPNLIIDAGTALGNGSTFALGSFKIATVIFNGVNSVFQEGDSAESTGDTGSNDMNGIVLGATGVGASLFGNIEIVEFIGYQGAHTAQNRTDVKAYLASRYPSL